MSANATTTVVELVLGGSAIGYAIDVWKTRRGNRREDRQEPLQLDTLQRAARLDELKLTGMLREQLLADLHRAVAERDEAFADLEQERRLREEDRQRHEAQRQLLLGEIGRLRVTIEEERRSADVRYSKLLERLEALQASIPAQPQEDHT